MKVDLATDAQRAMLGQMVSIIHTVRDGLPIEEAATLARVSKSRLQCWRALAVDGEEPFASFAEHAAAAAAEIGAKLDIIRNLKALSIVDSKAGETLLQRIERNQFAATLPVAGARPPTGEALSAEVAIAQGDSEKPLEVSLTALLEKASGEPVAVARFEPRR